MQLYATLAYNRFMLFMVISLAQPSYLYLVNYLVLSWPEIFCLQPSGYISVYPILAVFLCIRFVERIDTIRQEIPLSSHLITSSCLRILMHTIHLLLLLLFLISKETECLFKDQHLICALNTRLKH